MRNNAAARRQKAREKRRADRFAAMHAAGGQSVYARKRKFCFSGEGHDARQVDGVAWGGGPKQPGPSGRLVYLVSTPFAQRRMR